MIDYKFQGRLSYLPGGSVDVQMSAWPAVSGNWWEPTTGSFTCVAAYQAKGAASQAASVINLANPGTYDLTAPTGDPPSFNTSDGWTFDGVNDFYYTNVTPANDQTWSMIVRFSNCAVGYLWIAGGAAGVGGPWFGLEGNRADGNVLYANGHLYYPGTAAAAGVLAVAGNKGYQDGAVEAGTIGTMAGSFTPIVFGGMNNGGTAGSFVAVKIQAVAIYSTTLDATQVAEITTNMNAL